MEFTTCVISVWREDVKCKYILRSLQNTSVHKRLKINPSGPESIIFWDLCSMGKEFNYLHHYRVKEWLEMQYAFMYLKKIQHN